MNRDELKSTFAEFRKDFYNLSAADQEAIAGLLPRLQRYALEFLDFKQKADEELGDTDPELVSRFQGELVALLNTFDRDLSVYGDILRSLSGGEGINFLRRVWGWVAGNVISRTIDSLASRLGITSWSFGVTAGFPTGISSTVTIHFTHGKGTAK